MVKKQTQAILVGLLVLALSAAVARADLFEWEGNSVEGTPIHVTADLSITGDELTINLANISGSSSLHPADVFTSFYFDLTKDVSGTISRPSLLSFSGLGELYEGVVGLSNDIPVGGPGADDITSLWLARADMDVTKTPFLGLGIGTVGNSDLGPNNFPGLGGLSAGIYAGEITTRNLTTNPATPLVKGLATFTLAFEDLSGYTIGHRAAFGFGTAPDSIEVAVAPVPGAALLCLLGLGVAGIRLRKHA